MVKPAGSCSNRRVDTTDAILFVLVIISDIALIAYLRRWRKRQAKADRMMDSLRLAIKHNLGSSPVKLRLRRAS